MKIAIGAIIQETNTFSGVPGTLENFRSIYYLKDAEIRARLRDSSTEVSGFFDVLDGTECEVLPTVAAMAVSGGRLSRETYETLLDDLLRPLRQSSPPDAVLLALHGAMCTADDDDGDGAILAALRRALGARPLIVVTHDLHANLTKKKVALCDALVGYHTAPHVDHRDTGRRAARLLLRSLTEGKRPRNFFRKLPFIAPSVKMNTNRSPLGPIIRRAQVLEANSLTPSISVFWMQPWLDVAEAGAAVNVVCFGVERDALPPLGELADRVWDTKRELDVNLWSVGAAIGDAASRSGRPCVFADTGDAPPGGASGDSNYLLRAFVENQFGDEVLLTLTDPPAVERMYAAGRGAELTVSLGGAIDRVNFSPIKFSGRVAALSDGKFTYEGPIARGQRADMGRAAVFAIGRVKALVHERPVYTHDPAVYRAVGLEPTAAKAVVVKSPTQFRACYEPIARKIYEVETPGICNVNLRNLNFTRIPRPMYPFDDEESVASVYRSER